MEGNLAYVTVPQSGLKVVNLSNLSSPKEVPQYQATVPTGMEITHQITSDWLLGYSYQLRITNTSGSNMTTGWTVCFKYDHNVGNSGISNANISPQSSKPFWKLTNKSYNKTIYSGSNVTINWNAHSGNVGGQTLQNIKLILSEDADCGFDGSQGSIERPLYVKRHNSKSFVSGGEAHRLVSANVHGITNLASLGTTREEAPARFDVKGDVLISNGGDTAFKVFSGANGSSLSLKYSEQLAGRGNGSAIGDDNLAYIAQGDAGLMVVDLSNLTQPKLMGEFDFADDKGSANNVYYLKSSNKKYVFIADGLSGVKIVRVDEVSGSSPKKCTIGLLGLICINLFL